MSTTLELPDDVLTAVAAVAVRAAQAGQPVQEAVVQLLRQALAADPDRSAGDDAAARLARRREMTQKFLTGEWGVELAGYEAACETDRRTEQERADAWRE